MPSDSIPAFVADLPLEADKRQEVLARVHAEYARQKPHWLVLLDAFEAAGGFADGGYLWEFPREDSAQFQKRKEHCRYHNYLETLVDLYAKFVFTQGVKRSSTSPLFNAWLADVDGHGTAIDAVLRELCALALVHGHAGVLVDKSPDAPTGPSQADERGQVRLSVFTALAIPDWRHRQGALSSVKLHERAPDTSVIEDAPTGDAARQTLIWTEEGWARFSHDGALVSAGTPNLGLVPFVVLRPKARYTSPMLGRPLVPSANVIRAMFNRASEEDHVLRDQAFSLLTINVGPDGDPVQVKESLGSEVGANRALVVRGEARYETPSQAVPEAIRQNIAYLVEELYRAAHVRFAKQSKAAESGESIRLQSTELNEMLQGLGKALAECERAIAQAWFAWMAPTPEAGRAAYQAANVAIAYPDEFFLDDLEADLVAFAEALRLELGETMGRRIRKKAARRIEPDMPVDVQAVVDAEIDALAVPPTPVDTGDPEGDALEEALAGA